jgi:transcription elongation factor Elf1
MNPLEERDVSCPYCGESFEVLLDLSAGNQNYIEDCVVCCQPIEFDVRVDVANESVAVEVARADA